jgi:hypothetical protein
MRICDRFHAHLDESAYTAIQSKGIRWAIRVKPFKGTRQITMRALTQDTFRGIVVFPLHRARSVERVPELPVPTTLQLRKCAVLPLRRAEAARKAALLVNLRCLNAEIRALKANANQDSR